MAYTGEDEKYISERMDDRIGSVVPRTENIDKVAPGAKIEAVANAQYYAAVHDYKIKKWSKASFRLYHSIFIAFCCACANGYDGSLMTAILAMPHFQKVFGAGANLNTSVIFSIYTVGGIAGSPFSAWIADRFGRRASMAIGAVIIIVGAILAAAAHNFGALVGGRFILGMGISVMTVAAPAYAIEVAPPQWRGRVTGFYNCGWFGGSIPAAAITYGCNQIDSEWQFRIPLALQCFACVIVLGSVWWIPESPRYLMMRGKDEEARDYLIKYHGNGDPDNALVHLELMEMREGIRQDGIDKRWWDYRGLFNTHNARWRFGTVIMFLTFCTFSTGGLGYYNTLIYGLLDVTSPSRQLVFNLANSIISATGALLGTSLTDKMPRRKVLIPGTALLAGLLATNAALSDKIAEQVKANVPVTQGYAKGGLAANLLNGFFFSFAFTPLQTVIPAECMETTMRAKGLALSGAWLSALSFINLFAAPIALGKMGSNYMYVWVGCGIVETFIYFFAFVECQGRTLEELDWIFNQPHPVSASLKKEKVVVQEDRVVAEYVEDEDRV